MWEFVKVFMILESLITPSSSPSGLPWLRAAGAYRTKGSRCFCVGRKAGPHSYPPGKGELGFVCRSAISFALSKTKPSFHAVSGFLPPGAWNAQCHQRLCHAWPHPLWGHLLSNPVSLPGLSSPGDGGCHSVSHIGLETRA